MNKKLAVLLARNLCENTSLLENDEREAILFLCDEEDLLDLMLPPITRISELFFYNQCRRIHDPGRIS